LSTSRSVCFIPRGYVCLTAISDGLGVPPSYSGRRISVKSVCLADNRVSDVLPIVSNFALQRNPTSIKKKKDTVRTGLSVTSMRSEKLLCGTGRLHIKEKFPRANNCYKNNGLPACDARQNYMYQRFAGICCLHLQSFTLNMGRERFLRNIVSKLHGFTSQNTEITSTVTRTSNLRRITKFHLLLYLYI